MIPLNGQTVAGAQAFFSPRNVIAIVCLILLGTIAIVIGGIANLALALRWFVGGQGPDARQSRQAMRLVTRQSVLLWATWALSGTVLFLLNPHGRLAVAVPILLGVFFGGTAAASIGLLLTQRPLRPILIAAAQGSEAGVTAPGVLARLTSMWLLSSALPCAIIVTLFVIHSNGWIIPRTASIAGAVTVVSLAALLLGLPVMILTSRSISDPIREVVEAMAEVEQGRFGSSLGVYERSEIGRLQRGFNRMVSGLEERDRLRDLFGRHVGTDVARRALEDGASLSGSTLEAAILFIDLVGSTKMAATRPPEEVAEVLNDFFRIVVDAVEEGQGQINKFQGDAALAVFGAPLPVPQAASAALATARNLRSGLRQIPHVDFGIGVSAGPVFAGNIGAENRYEYTVIGDVVNEAARLADLAKSVETRIVCSAVAVERADATERGHWASHGDKLLRGRADSTTIWTSADC
jgi:class 3 adenylate cyclase